MSSPDVAEVEGMAASLTALAADVADQRQPEELTVEHVQSLVTAALQLYARTCEETGVFSPVTANGVTATEAALVSTQLLEAVDLEVFELTLWNSWGRAG